MEIMLLTFLHFFPSIEIIQSYSSINCVPSEFSNLFDPINYILRYYSSLEVASEYFRSGADKISIGSDAVYAAEEYLKAGVLNSTHSLFLVT